MKRRNGCLLRIVSVTMLCSLWNALQNQCILERTCNLEITRLLRRPQGSDTHLKPRSQSVASRQQTMIVQMHAWRKKCKHRRESFTDISMACDRVRVPVAGGSSIRSNGDICTQNHDTCNHAAKWACLSVVLIRQLFYQLNYCKKLIAPRTKDKTIRKRKGRKGYLLMRASLASPGALEF